MDDEQLGRAIAKRAILYTNLFDGEQYERLGAAARELLAKPVATREGVEKWAVKAWAEIEDHGWRGFSDGVLVALSHFAPPARPRMMIEGMTQEEMARQMFDAVVGPLSLEAQANIRRCAERAHRLATTPAPEVDPDAEAKEWCWRHYCAACPNKDERHYQSAEHLWGHEGEHGRHGWRAVAAGKKESCGE